MFNPTAGVVAVVENDDQMRHAMRRVLEMAGYMTELFESAEAFLGTREPSRASCLVVDVLLPGISGVELHQRLRAAGNATPTVFVTDYDDWRRRGFTIAEPDACLVEPFRAEMLVHAVNRTFGGSHD